MSDTFIDENKLHQILGESSAADSAEISNILKKGRGLKGLTPEEAAKLLNIHDEELTREIFETAAFIKQSIYGDRLVFFAPLYLSNYCVNDCEYCGFHARNRAARKKLTMDEVREQVSQLIDMGHKRLLLEFGEDPANNPFDYVLETIDTVYSVRRAGGEIRRVNVNLAATEAENYGLLKERGIGTYQLFQETYHRPTYESLHRGPKADFERQLYAMDRAFKGGIDDIGLGVLFGLYDWRFEVLGLITHAAYLKEKFGVGPHTISVPRFRPAETVEMQPTSPVGDGDFLKLIAVLRISVPYTGMIITTRERPEIRRRAFRTGITQASAASRTSPGGFGKKPLKGVEQFELSDRRSLDEITVSIMKEGFTPSFCTACYRRGRTGQTFMELAVPGDIREFCQPNSILTLVEYIEDHASDEGKMLGMEVVNRELQGIKNLPIKRQTEKRIERIRCGERDIYF